MTAIDPRSTRPLRRRIFFAARYLLAVSLVGYILFKVGLGGIARAALNIPLVDLLAALAGVAAVVAIHSWRYHLLLRRILPQTGWARSFQAVALGLGLGLVTPGRLGEAGRVILFPGRRMEATAALVVERFCVLLGLCIVSAICAAIHFPAFLPLALVVIGSLVFLACPPLRTRINRFLARYPSIDKKARPFSTFIETFSLTEIVVSTGLSFFCLGIQAGQLQVLLGGRGTVSFFQVLTLFPLSIFASMVPITVGGLGLREGALISLLVGAGVAGQVVAAASLVFYAVYALPLALVAAVILARARRFSGNGSTRIESGHGTSQGHIHSSGSSAGAPDFQPDRP